MRSTGQVMVTAGYSRIRNRDRIFVGHNQPTKKQLKHHARITTTTMSNVILLYCTVLLSGVLPVQYRRNTTDSNYVCSALSVEYIIWINRANNLARGQLNRENVFFPCLRSRLRIWSHATGSAVSSRVSPLIFLHPG